MRARAIVAVLLTLALSACQNSRDEEHEVGHGEHGEGEQADPRHNEIVLDQHVIDRNGIETEAARKRLLLGSLEVPAEVQMNPDKTAHVASLVPGRLTEIRAALGDTVEKDDVLANVESVELGEARAKLKAARARKKAADAAVLRASTLAGEGIAAKKSRVDAQARADEAAAEVSGARATLSVYGVTGGSGPSLPLKSPLSGTVIERHASPGEVVDRETDSFLVADLDQLWVMGRVYEQDIGRVAEGANAEIALIAYPGQTWAGVVDYVSSTLDEETRTVSIRVVLENPDGLLRPGMFGTIALGETEPTGSGETPEVLSVPDTALSTMGDRKVVFVSSNDERGAFEARDVVPGASAHGFVEIKDGLKEGEQVVSQGAFILKSEFMKSTIGEGHEH